MVVGEQEMTWTGPTLAAEGAWKTAVRRKRTAELEHELGMLTHVDDEVWRACGECQSKAETTQVLDKDKDKEKEGEE